MTSLRSTSLERASTQCSGQVLAPPPPRVVCAARAYGSPSLQRLDFSIFSCVPSKARGLGALENPAFPSLSIPHPTTRLRRPGQSYSGSARPKIFKRHLRKIRQNHRVFFLIFGPGYLVAVNRIERLRTRIWGDVPSTLYRSLNAFSKVLFRGLFGSYCSSGGPGFPCGRFHESPPEKSAFPKSDYTRQFALFCFPPHPLARGHTRAGAGRCSWCSSRGPTFGGKSRLGHPRIPLALAVRCCCGAIYTGKNTILKHKGFCFILAVCVLVFSSSFPKLSFVSCIQKMRFSGVHFAISLLSFRVGFYGSPHTGNRDLRTRAKSARSADFATAST